MLSLTGQKNEMYPTRQASTGRKHLDGRPSACFEMKQHPFPMGVAHRY
jgi:hypothetical protein